MRIPRRDSWISYRSYDSFPHPPALTEVNELAQEWGFGEVYEYQEFNNRFENFRLTYSDLYL